MSKVGQLIVMARRLQQRSVADLALTTGKSTDYIEKVEAGRLSGLPSTLLLFARELGINPNHMREAYLQDATDAAAKAWRNDQSVRSSVKSKGSKSSAKLQQ